MPARNEAPDVTRERPDFGMVNPLGFEAVREVDVLPVVVRAPPPVRGSPACSEAGAHPDATSGTLSVFVSMASA